MASEKKDNPQPSVLHTLVAYAIIAVAAILGISRGFQQTDTILGVMFGKNVIYEPVEVKRKGPKVFTLETIAPYDGTNTDNPYYLVVLGKVYDVTKGKQYYGTGDTYNVFLAQDATRAFVTGNFERNQTNSTIAPHEMDNFTDEEILGVKHWVDFYAKGGDNNKYFQVGVLYMENGYYDMNGNPTEKAKQVKQLFVDAKERDENRKNIQKGYPACNSQYKMGEGGKVWCQNPSHVPRKGGNSS
eukprot:m.183240 g.183240  ORF g.183240 m.183240 type:complete len:243 (-) comp15540_c0_seq7:365-1093(-)